VFKLFRLLATALAGISFGVGAQTVNPAQQEFAPKTGKGSVVVVISGQSGAADLAPTAQQIAENNDFKARIAQLQNELKQFLSHSPAALSGAR